MTDQLFVFRCNEVRKHAYDYRRGELQAAELRKFEEHIANCQACQNHVDRLENMLDAAATYDFGAGIDRDAIFASLQAVLAGPAEEQPAAPPAEPLAAERRTGPGQTAAMDRDALFSRITKEIAADLDATSVPPAVRIEHPELADEQENVVAIGEAKTRRSAESETSPARRSPAPWIVLGLAAGIAIGAFIPALFRAEQDHALPAGIAEKQVPTQSPLLEDPIAVTSVALADLALQPTPAAIDDVRVFGDPTANWSIRTQGTRRKLELSEGTVLVEFVPSADTSLEFVANDFTVRVTGTIFYASAEEGVVGVVTGAVEVDVADGSTVALTDGQEWSTRDGVRDAQPQTRRDATRFVDPAKHTAQLEARAAREPAPKAGRKAARIEAPRPPLSPEVVRTPTSSLRTAADYALREGRYDEAAQYYERMVDELSAADPANASLRLDLARIYIRHLDRSARAVTHLRQFVEDRPADPATPSARAELCRIIDEMGARDALCDPP